MIRNLRYDLIDADMTGVHDHPQKVMKESGFTVIQSEPVPIADCWWFRVKDGPEDLPSYLTEMGSDFKFSGEI